MSFTYLKIAACISWGLLSAPHLLGQKPVFHVNMQVIFESLEEASKDYENVYHLNLSGSGLSAVPEEIALMPNLISLYLSDNSLSDLGENISRLKNLEFLELSGNRFTEIPVEQLPPYPEFKELHIRDNRIKTIPPDLSTLKYLVELDAGSNQIVQVSGDILLPYLKKLRLDNNHLTSIPEFIQGSPKLEYLNCNGNEIKEIELIGKMFRLTSLNIGDNPIASIQPLGKLLKLEYLVLDWIDLTESGLTPIERMRNLKILSLEHCRLTSLPDFIAQLSELEELSLISNELTSLPTRIASLTQLKKLWLKGNRIPENDLMEIAGKLMECQIYK